MSRAGPELSERVELVRAALPDADQARFEQDLDQALDMAGSIRTCGLWARRRGLAACGLRSSARWPAVGGDRGAASHGYEPEWESEPLDVEDAIGRYLT